jgi:hypothetical protein
LLLEHGENTTRRIAGLEPVGEWVIKEILLCAFFVRFQGIVENWLEVGRCGSRVNVRHGGINEELGEGCEFVDGWRKRRSKVELYCLTKCIYGILLISAMIAARRTPKAGRNDGGLKPESRCRFGVSGTWHH